MKTIAALFAGAVALFITGFGCSIAGMFQDANRPLADIIGYSSLASIFLTAPLFYLFLIRSTRP